MMKLSLASKIALISVSSYLLISFAMTAYSTINVLRIGGPGFRYMILSLAPQFLNTTCLLAGLAFLLYKYRIGYALLAGCVASMFTSYLGIFLESYDTFFSGFDFSLPTLTFLFVFPILFITFLVTAHLKGFRLDFGTSGEHMKLAFVSWFIIYGSNALISSSVAGLSSPLLF